MLRYTLSRLLYSLESQALFFCLAVDASAAVLMEQAAVRLPGRLSLTC